MTHCLQHQEWEAPGAHPRGTVQLVSTVSSGLCAKDLGHSEQATRFVQSIWRLAQVVLVPAFVFGVYKKTELVLKCASQFIRKKTFYLSFYSL